MLKRVQHDYDSHFLNTETSSAQAAIFGMPVKSFSIRGGLMKEKIILKL